MDEHSSLGRAGTWIAVAGGAVLIGVLAWVAFGGRERPQTEPPAAPGSPLVAREGEVLLVADAWPPFNFAENEEPAGYMIDVAREVFEAEGLRVVYRNVPWKRALQGTLEGRYHGAIGASRTDGENLLFPEQELARNRLAFYVRRGDPWRFAGLASLSGVRLGVIHGYDYRRWLIDYIEENADDPGRVQRVGGSFPLAQNVRKLVAGRIDVVVDCEPAIIHAARSAGLLERIEPAGHGTEVAECFIAFSTCRPESPRLAEVLSHGIERLRASGRLEEILARYGLRDWREETLLGR